VSTLATRRNLLIVLIDAGVWASWSAVCGYIAHRIPAARLSRDRGLLRIRAVLSMTAEASTPIATPSRPTLIASARVS